MSFTRQRSGRSDGARRWPIFQPEALESRQVLASIVHAEQRRDDQVIGVGFGEDAADQAASDAIKQSGTQHP